MKTLIINLNIAIDKTAEIPNFKPGCIHRLANTSTQPGGKGVNVARVIKELGGSPVLAGFISGYNGRWICEQLRREALPALLVNHDSGESRLCYSIVDRRGLSIDLNEEGPVVPPASQQLLLLRVSREAAKYGIAAVCGRISGGIKKGFYERLTKILKSSGAFVAFDTSGAALLEGLKAGADLIKINKSEFEELVSEKLSATALRRCLKEFSPGGLKGIIVTDGPKETLALVGDVLFRLTPPKLPHVKSAVGAGDSFMAGFLTGLQKGEQFENCLKLGAGCAASDCLSLATGRVNLKEAKRYGAITKIRR